MGSFFRSLFFALVTLTAAAGSWELGPFIRPRHAQPVITPDKAAVFHDPVTRKQVHWESLHTFNPAAIVRSNKIYVLYRAEDDSGEKKIGGHTSRLGLATSEDGIHFRREPEPVFYPANDDQKEREWPGGCEDPRIVEAENGTYVLTYTQWNRKRYDAAIATSSDLHTWVKHGPAFERAHGGKYQQLQYKSLGILTELRDGRLKAAKVNGKYLMLWGEVTIHLATSSDLIAWDPVEDSEGKLITVLEGRPGLFDSGFPEVGPPPVVMKNGVLLLYNGKNAAENGSKDVGREAYSVGEVLLSSQAPGYVLQRVDAPVFRPELQWERSGQYVAGTTFAEGLVYWRNKWFLYYGCADSFVGVAIAENMQQ